MTNSILIVSFICVIVMLTFLTKKYILFKRPENKIDQLIKVLHEL